MTFSRSLPRGRRAKPDWLKLLKDDPTQADLRRALKFGAMGAPLPENEQALVVRAEMDTWRGLEAAQSDERASPVQHERAEQVALTRAVHGRWYARGYRHIEQATPDGSDRAMRAASRQGKAGVRPGVPDVWLHIPGDGSRNQTRGVLELKRANLRPKREVDPWWYLEWEPEHERSTRYGLTGAQALMLQLLDACGYHVRVAYGHEQALVLLDMVAGPERQVAWPMYGCERGRWVD